MVSTVTIVERGTSSEEFGKLPTEAIVHFWPAIQALLHEKAKEWLELATEQEIFQAMHLGFVDVWIALEDGEVQGFVIGQWERYTKRSFYNILAIAGDGLDKYIKAGLQKIEQYAMIGGAYEIIIQGRFGWKRKLKAFGYHQTRVQLRKNTSILWRN